jgi:hypothetical protein
LISADVDAFDVPLTVISNVKILKLKVRYWLVWIIMILNCCHRYCDCCDSGHFGCCNSAMQLLQQWNHFEISQTIYNDTTMPLHYYHRCRVLAYFMCIKKKSFLEIVKR